MPILTAHIASFDEPDILVFHLHKLLHQMHEQLPPNDWKDAHLLLHPALQSTILRSRDFAMAGPPTNGLDDMFEGFFGLPVHFRSTSPPEKVQLVVENEIEKALRRNPHGTIVVAQPTPLPEVWQPWPEPTVRDLVRKWRRKIRRGKKLGGKN